MADSIETTNNKNVLELTVNVIKVTETKLPNPLYTKENGLPQFITKKVVRITFATPFKAMKQSSSTQEFDKEIEQFSYDMSPGIFKVRVAQASEDVSNILCVPCKFFIEPEFLAIFNGLDEDEQQSLFYNRLLKGSTCYFLNEKKLADVDVDDDGEKLTRDKWNKDVIGFKLTDDAAKWAKKKALIAKSIFG